MAYSKHFFVRHNPAAIGIYRVAGDSQGEQLFMLGATGQSGIEALERAARAAVDALDADIAAEEDATPAAQGTATSGDPQP